MNFLTRSVARLCCIAAAFLAIGGFLASAPQAQAQVYSSNNQWASYTSGAYTFYNDVWNPNGGSQWLYVENTSCNAFYISSDFWGSGVKSFGNVSFSPYNSIWGYSWCAFQTATPSGAGYDNSFDCWDTNGDEIMIWENWSSNVSPAGSIVASAYINSTEWNVWIGNVGHTVISYTRDSQTWSTTEGPNAFFQSAYENGCISSQTVKQIQFGFEVTSTNGWQNFNCNYAVCGWG